MLRPVLLKLLAALWLASLVPAGEAAGAEPSVAVTVVPFSSLEAEQNIWLGKAIADLLTRHLATVPSITVLERERLQTFLEEMELQDSGFVSEADAGRLGRVAKVDQVIYGNFSLKRSSLTVNLILVDLETQRVLQQEQISGDLEKLQEMMTRLALAFLEHRGVSLTDEESARINFAQTNSLPATRYFYKAFDHYDHGRYEDAFGAFYAAARQDSDYLEAELWAGRMLEALGYDDLAILAYEKLAQRAGRKVEVFDAQMFLARVLEPSDGDRAIAIYLRLMSSRPLTPHGLEAAYRLAGLLEMRGDLRGAYEAFAAIDGFRDLVEERSAAFAAETRRTDAPSRATLAEIVRTARRLVAQSPEVGDANDEPWFYVTQSGIRQSRFFNWVHALGLYREAIIRMTLLYREIEEPTAAIGTPPDPPRGVFLVSPENPVIAERHFGRARALFHEQRYTENWRETFYAVMVPPGYVATGAELRVSGRALKAAPHISFMVRLLPFPLPKEYQNSWLGMLAGQTQNISSLHKSVYFHGQHRRFLALQFIENHSEILDWELELHLMPEPDAGAGAADPESTAAPALPSDGFREGLKIAEIPSGETRMSGATQPLFRLMAHPKKALALADHGLGGLVLVTARGKIGGTPTDLWLSRGGLEGGWSEPLAMPVNGASEDYAPQLLRAEDGGLRLFWLSDRRGRGWEIWTSVLPPGEDSGWSPPARVPLEFFHPTGLEGRTDLAETHLHFAVTQDRRGRWVLAYPSPGEDGTSPDDDRLVVLTSTDAQNWREATSLAAAGARTNLMLIEDTKGLYRLGAVTADGSLNLWRSTNLVDWSLKEVTANRLGARRRGHGYPAQLFAEPGGQLLVLFSDRTFGLQYARFDPDLGEPATDLVKDASLEAFAAVALEDGSYLVALQRNEGVELRRYRKFQSPDNGDNPRYSGIYTETDLDGAGNRWHRTYARMRFILPDVTSVGVEDDGRIWWGIETGMYSAKGSDLFRQDVAQGFFFHHVTDIVPCGAAVYFSSRHLEEVRVGYALPRSGTGSRTTYSVGVRPLASAEGQVTAMTCTTGQNPVVGTSSGDLVALLEGDGARRARLPDGQAVVALAAEPEGAGVYVGTDRGRLYRWTDDLREIEGVPSEGERIQAIAIDRRERLWLAVESKGLYLQRSDQWQAFPGDLMGLPYFSVRDLEADPIEDGIWMLASPAITSPGLIYFDGEAAHLLNPPHRRLADPIDMDMARDGSIWIGTAFNGLYHLERAPR